jgi:hypothetical protein
MAISVSTTNTTAPIKTSTTVSSGGGFLERSGQLGGKLGSNGMDVAYDCSGGSGRAPPWLVGLSDARANGDAVVVVTHMSEFKTTAWWMLRVEAVAC